MLFPIFSAAIFAGLSVAQYADLPSCAQDCASQEFSGGSYGNCGTDPKCICSDQDFIGTIACCLVGACDASDQAAAISFAHQICQANGVSVPATATCSTAAGAASSGTSAASGTPASASASATGSVASTDATAAATGTEAGTGVASAATGTTASTGASAAWAPRQTAAVGLELLGGLCAAGLALL